MLNIARVSAVQMLRRGPRQQQKKNQCVSFLKGSSHRNQNWFLMKGQCLTHSSRILAAELAETTNICHYIQIRTSGRSHRKSPPQCSPLCSKWEHILHPQGQFPIQKHNTVTELFFLATFTMLSCRQCFPAGQECVWCIVRARLVVAEGYITVGWRQPAIHSHDWWREIKFKCCLLCNTIYSICIYRSIYI